MSLPDDLKFTAEDFKNVTLGHHGATPTIEQKAANIANRLLAERIGEWKKVSGRDIGRGEARWIYSDNNDLVDCTHTAILIGVKKL